METLIRKIWRGEYYGAENTANKNKELDRLFGCYDKKRRAFYDSLTDGQKAAYEELEKAESKYTSANEEEIYVEGFRTGMRLIIESIK